MRYRRCILGFVWFSLVGLCVVCLLSPLSLLDCLCWCLLVWVGWLCDYVCGFMLLVVVCGVL